MTDPEELRNHANECLKFAKVAESDNDRALLLSMADAWLKLAEQTERISRLIRQAADPDISGSPDTVQ